MGRKRRITLFLVLALGLLWAGGRSAVRLPPAQVYAPAVMADYRPGMDLHATFESLSRVGSIPAELVMLDRNVAAWTARWRLLQGAERRIDVSYFILKPDIFGAAFLGHLLKKAQAGVQVRVHLDGLGTRMSRDLQGKDYLDTLANTPNVRVNIYRPLFSRHIEAVLSLNPVAAVASDHDKILVADGRTAIIGGRNISAEYFAHPADRERAFHDADLLLRGESAGQRLVSVFERQYLSGEAFAVPREAFSLRSHRTDLLLAYEAMDAWLRAEPLPGELRRLIRAKGLPWVEALHAHPHLYGALTAQPETPLRARIQVVDSRTRLLSAEDPVSRSLVRVLRSAREEILAINPYLVLSEEVVERLAETGRRGVRVTVLTNSPVSSDNALSQAFFLEQWPELLARVPNLRLFVGGEPRNLHSKLAVVDGSLTLVGTYNLDPLSMAVNGELMIAVWSDAFARRAAAQPRSLLDAGPPVLYEYRIRRDARGRPIRMRDGAPAIAFGPWDHSNPDDWTRLAIYWRLLRGAQVLPGVRAIF